MLIGAGIENQQLIFQDLTDYVIRMFLIWNGFYFPLKYVIL